MHSLLPLSPVYVPTPQSSQTFAPPSVSVVCLVPAGQNSQTPSAFWNMPEGHGRHSALPGSLVEKPSGHTSHDTRPLDAWNLPVGHSLHSGCAGKSWNEPLSHSTHSTLDVASLVNLPAEQLVHDS